MVGRGRNHHFMVKNNLGDAEMLDSPENQVTDSGYGYVASDLS
jgi:hypothetical protein